MLSDKAVQEFKDIFKKEYGQELSDAEARDQGERLIGFFDILYKQALTEHRRKLRLKKEKIKGFYLDDENTRYTCAVCRETVQSKNIWWNPKGLRCRDCWRNIKNRVIPSLTYDSDNKVWMKEWEISSEYSIHPSTRRKLERDGALKGRHLKRKDGSTYCTVYLIKENEDFFKKYKKKPAIKVKFINPKANPKKKTTKRTK